jgi:hypothetical protein
VTTNQQLAGQLRHQADDIMGQRRILLVTAVALAESRTVTGARKSRTVTGTRKVLAGWDGPESLKIAALELLDRLADAAGT